MCQTHNLRCTNAQYTIKVCVSTSVTPFPVFPYSNLWAAPWECILISSGEYSVYNWVSGLEMALPCN